MTGDDKEVGVIQQLAAQDLERHRTVAHSDLLGEEDRAHAARAQAADNAKPAGQLTGKLRFGFRGLSGELSAVARTELNLIGVGLLASVAGLHGRQGNSPVARILTEVLPQRESALG
jgi:hypothetical protein